MANNFVVNILDLQKCRSFYMISLRRISLMEIEVIPNTNLYEKDCKKFKMIRKDSGETNYYVTLKNNGGR